LGGQILSIALSDIFFLFWVYNIPCENDEGIIRMFREGQIALFAMPHAFLEFS
jgi:hypothetical protein